MNKSLQRIRLAIWLLVGYAVFLIWVVYSVQEGLWLSNQALFEIMELRHRDDKLPCSSEINENCAIYVK